MASHGRGDAPGVEEHTERSCSTESAIRAPPGMRVVSWNIAQFPGVPHVVSWLEPEEVPPEPDAAAAEPASAEETARAEAARQERKQRNSALRARWLSAAAERRPS